MTVIPGRRAALGFLLLAACSPTGSATSASAVDSAGIAISTAPATDQAAPWHVSQLYRLAPDDPDSPLHLIRWPAHIGIDSAANIFVYNEVTERVEVFDRGGRFVAPRGRRGGGPGEYEYVGHVTVRPDGTLLVVDQGRRVIVGFDPAGGILPHRSFFELGFPNGGIEFHAETTLIQTRDVDEERHPRHALRWITPDRDTTLAVLRPATRGQARFRCASGSTLTINGGEVLFAPTMAWSVGSSGVAVTTGARYEVAVFAGGRLKRLIRRPISPMETKAEDAHRQYPGGIALLQGRTCRQDVEALSAELGFAPNLPVLSGVRYAPDGNLWVQRFVLPGAAPVIDLFSLDGEYLGTMTGVGFPVGFASGGRFLGLVADVESGAYAAYLYQLEPAPW